MGNNISLCREIRAKYKMREGNKGVLQLEPRQEVTHWVSGTEQYCVEVIVSLAYLVNAKVKRSKYDPIYHRLITKLRIINYSLHIGIFRCCKREDFDFSQKCNIIPYDCILETERPIRSNQTKLGYEQTQSLINWTKSYKKFQLNISNDSRTMKECTNKQTWKLKSPFFKSVKKILKNEQKTRLIGRLIFAEISSQEGNVPTQHYFLGGPKAVLFFEEKIIKQALSFLRQRRRAWRRLPRMLLINVIECKAPR